MNKWLTINDDLEALAVPLQLGRGINLTPECIVALEAFDWALNGAYYIEATCQKHVCLPAPCQDWIIA